MLLNHKGRVEHKDRTKSVQQMEKQPLIDNGGRRSGIDRRIFSYSDLSPERRSSTDRRSGVDRRKKAR